MYVLPFLSSCFQKKKCIQLKEHNYLVRDSRRINFSNTFSGMVLIGISPRITRNPEWPSLPHSTHQFACTYYADWFGSTDTLICLRGWQAVKRDPENKAWSYFARAVFTERVIFTTVEISVVHSRLIFHNFLPTWTVLFQFSDVVVMHHSWYVNCTVTASVCDT